MYNKCILGLAHEEIETQIRTMPQSYTSRDFYTSFENNHRQKYEDLIRIYTDRRHDRPHAVQILHSQLMHTVNECFSSLTRKVRTVSNPKGGEMSLWVKM